MGHANQDFYHFKPGLQHVSSRGKEFMCQLTQSAISSNPSSSLIKASTKEHPQPINDPIGELITKGKSQTTYDNLFLKWQLLHKSDPLSSMCSQSSHGEESQTTVWVQLLGNYVFQFSSVDYLRILVPPIAIISICMPTSFEAALLPTIPRPVVQALIAMMTTTSTNTATATALRMMILI